MAFLQEEKAFETVVDECSVKFAATARALHELLDEDQFDIEDAAKPFEARNAGMRGLELLGCSARLDCTSGCRCCIE